MEFVAYALYDEVPFTIEPADHRRAWMDATTNQFAYRCLPLTIANQAGWILRCPIDFEVVWNGDERHGCGLEFSESLKTHYLSSYILDHFGHGILTFSLPYLFRTPPGYGLLVRGATNFWVANAHPLDGLVETDWLETTFTMNWKIVEPDRPVRFQAGDPFCMLQPYPLELLESLAPRSALLDNEPELKRGLEAWSAQRAAFIDKPDRQPAEWQKDYFQGKTLEGERKAGHKTRLHLKRFE